MAKICNVCGITHSDKVRFCKNRSICTKCYNVQEKIKEQKRREFETQTKDIDVKKMKVLIKQFVDMWESGDMTKALLECTYIDFCKIIGHSRKKHLMKQHAQ